VSVGLALLTLLAVPARPADAPDGPVELLFLYGSEKKDWINDVTKAFHASNPTVDGHPIRVIAEAKGSGDTIDELLEGGRKAHLISPASGAYLKIGNARAREKGEPDLVSSDPKNLVLSPVVIAMWKPMAKALGWPEKPIGWKDLRELAKAGDWSAVGYPQGGTFKFGHTHPESSNSGLITLFSEVYAATGKKKLTVADVEAPQTAEFLKDLERSVVHYGSSTGFFADTMFSKGGHSYLSAAVLYENLVVESYSPKIRGKLDDDVVAIYPKEGTFWSDHPVAVVERDWVTPLHRQAAKKYIDFLLQDEQQKKALKYGFRPGPSQDSGDLGAPIDRDHGADPSKPGGAVLDPPDVDVMKACLKAWRQYKKKARVVLVFDRSYKMNFNSKLFRAQDGAGEIIDALGPGDWVSILAFNDTLQWLEPGLVIRGDDDKAALKKKLEVEAKGKRKLFDAIAEAHKHLKEEQTPGVISAVVVLANGEPDRGSSLSLDDLLAKVKVGNGTKNETRIYTFAYGSAEDAEQLKAIAKATQAKAFEGKPDTVRKVMKELATFF
jgi:Ca-activated chloride channel family protein